MVGDECLQDEVQFQLLEIWDSLRMRHARVSIVMEAKQLTDERLAGVTELVHFEVQNVGWRFFGGDEEQALLEDAQVSWRAGRVGLV